MPTRAELLQTVSERYRASCRADKKTIVDEFAARRVFTASTLCASCAPGYRPSGRRQGRRGIYGAAEGEALMCCGRHRIVFASSD
jgi:hypothetical protein